MSASRRQPSRTTQLAATLLARGDVPYEHAKLMTEDQIISLYQFHHNIRHAEGGTIHFSNLEPMLLGAHRKRTAEIDVPAIAKNKRIRRKQAEHEARRAFVAVVPLRDERDPWRKARGRIRSAGFDKRVTRTMSGQVRPRKQRKARS